MATQQTPTFFRFLYNQVIPCLLVTLGILGVWLLTRSMEPVIYDWLMRHTAPNVRLAVDPVKILLIDTPSVEQLTSRFGAAPWQAQRFYQILAPLLNAQPGLIVLMDALALPPPAPALAEIPASVLWGISSEQWADYRRHPQASFSRLALARLDSDLPDGILRTLHPYYRLPATATTSQDEDPKTPAKRPNRLGSDQVQLDVALKAVLQYLDRLPAYQGSWRLRLHSTPGEEGQDLTLRSTLMPQDQIHLALDENNRYLLRWYTAHSSKTLGGALVTHPYVTLAQYEQWTPRQRLDWGRGYIILVSATAHGMRSDMPSSLSGRHLNADIVATAIANLLNGQSLIRAPGWLRSLCLLMAFFSAFFLRIRLMSFGRAVLYVAALMVGYFWISLLALTRGGMVLDIITPEVFMLLGLVAGTVWWSTNRDRQLETLETTLSQLVAPSVLAQMRRHKKGIVPGGQRLEITSLFVDIRNFTALAENLPAQEVTDLLNAFYTEVERVVFRHRGTIDKYMGDGVLVMFGAPLEDRHHADVAIAAACELRQALIALDQRWWQERNISFRAGVSVNSGFAYVGFVGPMNKIEYTAIGDTVNLAVRLQECNKRLGASVIISEHTLRYCQHSDHPELTNLGPHHVRGRETAVGLYTLMDELPAS